MTENHEKMNRELVALGEALSEMVMNNMAANDFVMRWAEMSYEHFVATMDVDPEPKIRDELFCQYQVQAWNKIMSLISI